MQHNLSAFKTYHHHSKWTYQRRSTYDFCNDSHETAIGTLKVESGGRIHDVKFHVVNRGAVSLLGALSILQMRLIDVNTGTAYRSQLETLQTAQKPFTERFSSARSFPARRRTVPWLSETGRQSSNRTNSQGDEKNSHRHN